MRTTHQHNLLAKTLCAVFVVFALCACASLAGCQAKTDEQAIEEAITSELDGYAEQTDEKARSFVQSMDIGELSVFGIEAKDFAKRYFAGFEYSIVDITIEEDTATATISVKCKSRSWFMKTLSAASDEFLKSAKTKHLTDAEASKQAGGLILSTLDETPVAACKDIVISFSKTNDTWQPARSADEYVLEAMQTN